MKNKFCWFFKLFSLFLSLFSSPLTTPVLFEAVTPWILRVRFQGRDMMAARSAILGCVLFQRQRQSCQKPLERVQIDVTCKRSSAEERKEQRLGDTCLEDHSVEDWRGKVLFYRGICLAVSWNLSQGKFLLTVENCTDFCFPVFELQVTCHL